MNYSAASALLSPILTPIYIVLPCRSTPEDKYSVRPTPPGHPGGRPTKRWQRGESISSRPAGMVRASSAIRPPREAAGRHRDGATDRRAEPGDRSIAFRVRGSNATSGQQQISYKNVTRRRRHCHRRRPNALWNWRGCSFHTHVWYGMAWHARQRVRPSVRLRCLGQPSQATGWTHHHEKLDDADAWTGTPTDPFCSVVFCLLMPRHLALNCESFYFQSWIFVFVDHAIFFFQFYVFWKIKLIRVNLYTIYINFPRSRQPLTNFLWL